MGIGISCMNCKFSQDQKLDLWWPNFIDKLQLSTKPQIMKKFMHVDLCVHYYMNFESLIEGLKQLINKFSPETVQWWPKTGWLERYAFLSQSLWFVMNALKIKIIVGKRYFQIVLKLLDMNFLDEFMASAR